MARTDGKRRVGGNWLRRAIAYFDPARDGFVRRVVRFVAVASAFVVLAALVALAAVLQQPMGHYAASATLLELGWPSMALRVSERLLEMAPAQNDAFYALHAANLRNLGRYDEQLSALEDGVVALPDGAQIHAQLCWYGTLFEDVTTVGAAALDASCDAAIELATEFRARGTAHARRAMRRAHAVGDLSGAAEDMAQAFQEWDAAGARVRRMPYPWAAWRATIEAGQDPLAGDALQRERERF